MNFVGFASQSVLTREELLAAPTLRPARSALDAIPQIKGAVRANKALAALDIQHIADLFEYLPIDEREQVPISSLLIGQSATIVGQVQTIRSRPVRRRGMRPLVEASVGDGSGSLTVVFFNQPWLVSRYQPGVSLLLHGTYRKGNQFAVTTHALIDRDLSQSEQNAVAHYRATAGITSTQLLALVRENIPLAYGAFEPLPAYIRRQEALPDQTTAVIAGHHGKRAAARKRFAFDELFFSQLALLQARSLRGATTTATPLTQKNTLTTTWLDNELPFELTADQRRAMAALEVDLQKPHPMQRLLMGDVGSGKTVVALYALLRAVEHGLQGALMAPTETLAEQHHATLQSLLGKQLISIGLLTGSTPAKRRRTLLAQLASGELSLVVGTHALIEETVQFSDLAVAVIDEQHRFGVQQRAAFHLKEQAAGKEGKLLLPHILHMTATPIPRTLALTLYGDLDVTTLRELPAGRKPIVTTVVDGDDKRTDAFTELVVQLKQGRQGFVIYPLVEESAALEARAATAELERLRAKELAGFRLGLLHGRLNSQEKSETMAQFVAGKIDVLVSTTVVEVGVDIPNATVMIVENAERFGIAQLHQLRGRVGRGEHASHCFLVGSHQSARLRALQEYQDGFKLAEIDLKLRGEGELVGTRQSGQARFKHAVLPEDLELLERARHWAQKLTRQDPELKQPVHQLLAVVLTAKSADGISGAIPA